MSNYNDDLPDWLRDAESDDDLNPADIESPTDGPPPDWMRVAASSGSSSLTDENTPDWLKAIQAGKGKKENDEKESEPAAVTPSAEESGDGLSDIERLLAEEGIDLSNVGEDRPVGAEGMSARDWLIASSDDEVIRRRIGSEPVATEPPERPKSKPAPQPEPRPAMPAFVPEPVSSQDDDKMIVEQDLPDWLQEFSEESEISEESAPAPVEAAGLPASATPPGGIMGDKMIVEEDLPDWLREVADEISAEPVLVEDLSDESIAGLPISDFDVTADEDLPDWLRQTAQETEPKAEPVQEEPRFSPISPQNGGMVVEEELPDWLREVEEEAELTSDESELVPSFEDVSVPTAGDELPGWLRKVEESDTDTEALLFEHEAAPQAVSSATPEVEIDEAELPDWLREVQEGEEVEEQPVAVQAEAEAPAEDRLVIEEELPGWLQQVEEEEIVAPAAGGEASIDVEEEGLPDWLREVQEEEEEPVQPIRNLEAVAGATGGVDELIDEEGLPDWLQEVEEEEAFEPSEPSPEEEEFFVAEDELVTEEELPAWLREAQEETEEVTAEVFDFFEEPVLGETVTEEAEVIIEEELPDWLRAVGEEPEPKAEPVAEMEPAEPEAVEVTAAPVEEVTLAEVQPEVISEPEEPAPVKPVPAPEPIVEERKLAAQPAPTGLPDWLRKLREGEREEERAVSVQGRPGLRPISAEPVLVEIKAEDDQGLPADADERLRLAHEARDEGDLEKAVRIYDTLVASGVYLDRIIDDMQQAIKSYPSNYLLYQVMGDAMMKDGRLQSALDAYRQALVRL